MIALHEDNISRPLPAARRWIVSSSGYDPSPCWATLDTVGREWLARGEMVQWRRSIIDETEITTVRAINDKTITRFVDAVEARAHPRSWIPTPLIHLEVVNATDPANPIYRNDLTIIAIKVALARSWWPGWSVTWCESAEEALSHGGKTACRTQMRIVGTRPKDKPVRLIAVATVSPNVIDNLLGI